MDIREAVLARLLASPAVTAVVGDRIGWLLLDQGFERPALVLTLVSEVEDEHLDGISDRVARVQADVQAYEIADLVAAVEAVRDALRPAAVIGDLSFGQAQIDGPRDRGELIGDTLLRVTSLDFLMRYQTT